MRKFNKTDIEDTFMEKTGLPRTKAIENIELVLLSIIDTLAKAKDEEPDSKGVRAKLTIVGFGSYELRELPKRTRRNPQTQNKVIKSPENVIRFKEGKSFNERTNK